MRATAFLKRSIRQDSRLLSHHLVRCAMAAFILWMFFTQYATYSRRAAAGGAFATGVVLSCYWFLTFIGGIHFSTAIVEEKEEQTLPLLRMTGASAFSILAGKSIPRLTLTILLLAVTTPFLTLALTLGGVLPLGLVSSTLGICCYSIMLSQLGLLSSVICRTAPRAFLLTSVLWVVFELCHWWYMIAQGLCSYALKNTAVGATGQLILDEYLDRVPECTLIGNLSEGLLSFSTLQEDGALWDRLTSLVNEVWYFHMSFHLVLAAILFLLSWLLFEPCTARAGSEGVQAPTPLVSVSESRARVWDDALAWKTWRYVSGGRLWFWLRAVGTTLLIFGVFFLFSLLEDSTDSMEADFIAGMMAMLGTWFFVINLSRLFGQVINVEIHGKTLSALVMLPARESETLWSMIRGLVPGICAGAVCGLLGYSYFILEDPDDFADVLAEPWFWHFFTWFAVAVHLGLLLTTQIRYGGMIVGFLAVALLPFFCCVPIGTMGGGAPGSEELYRYVVPLVLMGIEFVACIHLQRAIVDRVKELACR